MNCTKFGKVCQEGYCVEETNESACIEAGYKCTSAIRGCGHYQEFNLSCDSGVGVACCEEIPYCGDGVCFYHEIPGYGENEINCPEDCVPETGCLTDEFKFETPSNKLNLGEGLLDVVARAIVEEDMPNFLADRIYADNYNDEFGYSQRINHGNLILSNFSDRDYNNGEWTVGIKIQNNEFILNYTLDFANAIVPSAPSWERLDTTYLTLLGKQYYILSQTPGTTLNLLGVAESATLEEGESATFVINGVTYEVSLDFVGASTARFTVNGEITNALAIGETQKVAGIYISVKSIVSQQYAEGVKKVEFILGKEKIKLVSGSEIELNDNALGGLKSYFVNSGNDLWRIIIEWRADDDLFITEENEVVIPGFETLKFRSDGMTYTSAENYEEVYLVGEYCVGQGGGTSGGGGGGGAMPPEEEKGFTNRVRNWFGNLFRRG